MNKLNISFVAWILITLIFVPTTLIFRQVPYLFCLYLFLIFLFSPYIKNPFLDKLCLKLQNNIPRPNFPGNHCIFCESYKLIKSKNTGKTKWVPINGKILHSWHCEHMSSTSRIFIENPELVNEKEFNKYY